MFLRTALPLLALAGVSFALISSSKKEVLPPPPPSAPPPAAPYVNFVAGTGMVEPASEAVAIASPIAGLISEILVKAGDRVEAGAPLLRLDSRREAAAVKKAQAQVAVSRAAVSEAETAIATAEAELRRQNALPRSEELPAASAQVKAAEAEAADQAQRLARLEAVKDARAVAADELAQRRHAAAATSARAEEAGARLKLLQAGAWKPDLEISTSRLSQARAALESSRAKAAAAEAELAAATTELERLEIRAPFAGQVLRVYAHPGELAPVMPVSKPLMYFGDTRLLHIRVDIDESEAWRLAEGARATATARGNRSIFCPLDFVRIESLVVPKSNSSGDSAERIDTRVLQLVFAVDPVKFPVRPGQQVDVSIEVAK